MGSEKNAQPRSLFGPNTLTVLVQGQIQHLLVVSTQIGLDRVLYGHSYGISTKTVKPPNQLYLLVSPYTVCTMKLSVVAVFLAPLSAMAQFNIPKCSGSDMRKLRISVPGRSSTDDPRDAALYEKCSRLESPPVATGVDNYKNYANGLQVVRLEGESYRFINPQSATSQTAFQAGYEVFVLSLGKNAICDWTAPVKVEE
ncbi:hypothetical protein A1F95_09688, partial [Pyrenophora tritici-repentis]